VLTSRAYLQGDTAVFVVWDEDTPMPNLVVTPSVHPGTTVPARYDHYSLLRTTEELLGLPLLGQATRAQSLRDAFHL
jgi:hypothetical protein